MTRDRGARKLIFVFFAVVALVSIFYGYLTWRALRNPMFFIEYPEPERSRVVIAAETPTGPGTEAPLHSGVQRGRRLYLGLGCAVCHGAAGEGGVKSPNYVKETIPALDVLAERMFLLEPEDVEAVLSILDVGRPLDEETLDVPRAAAVVAQYESVRKIILSGNPGGKKDPAGHPPLDMPKWDDRLTESQVNDVIAYLLSLYPWEQADRQ